MRTDRKFRRFIRSHHPKGYILITLNVQHLNEEISQSLYDRCLDQIDLHRLPCTCGRHDMVLHSSYERYIRTSNGKFKLLITRVRCKSCGKTHAILLSSIVPWQSVQLAVQIRILKGYQMDQLMTDNIHIDEQVIFRVKMNFKNRYKAWMLSFHLTFDDDLVFHAYRSFRSNFMQVRKGSYRLFPIST